MSLRYFFHPDKEAIKKAKELGDKTGYDCAGPASSLLLGRAGLPTLFRVFDKGEDCLSNFETIGQVYTKNKRIKQELTDLYAEATAGGACRFWREHDKETFTKNEECKDIAAKIRSAELACYKK